MKQKITIVVILFFLLDNIFSLQIIAKAIGLWNENFSDNLLNVMLVGAALGAFIRIVQKIRRD